MVRAAGEGQSLRCGAAGKVWEWYSELKCVCVRTGESGSTGKSGQVMMETPSHRDRGGVFTLRCWAVGVSQQPGGLCTEQ